ncbi:hypothetical protein [Nitrospira japonica]|nr:hypothetical protein [Nitrospira japonica]
MVGLRWLRRGCRLGLAGGVFHRGIQWIDGLLVPAWDEMAVQVYRDLD